MKAAICQPQMGKEALLGLLSAKSEGERAFVFDAAREARHRAFGNKVFLYGFLYLSTHCRNDCAFCQYRRSNSSLERYRKPLGEMLEAAGRLAADGIHLLDLTLGEDPYYVEPAGFHRLLELVSALKETTGLPIMVSPGVLSAEQLVRLREPGRTGTPAIRRRTTGICSRVCVWSRIMIAGSARVLRRRGAACSPRTACSRA